MLFTISPSNYHYCCWKMASHSAGMEEQVAEFVICYSQDARKQYAFPCLVELKLVSWLRDFILENKQKKKGELVLSWAKRGVLSMLTTHRPDTQLVVVLPITVSWSKRTLMNAEGLRARSQGDASLWRWAAVWNGVQIILKDSLLAKYLAGFTEREWKLDSAWDENSS